MHGDEKDDMRRIAETWSAEGGGWVCKVIDVGKNRIDFLFDDGCDGIYRRMIKRDADGNLTIYAK